MPFVSRSELEHMQADNAQLAEAVAHFEGMEGLIGLAGELRDELVAYLDSNPELSASEIGELAYRAVLTTHIKEATDEVVERYEQENRSSLYARVIKEVEKTDGPNIFESVKQKVETDPELATQLRESARKELAARAIDVVRHEITVEQQEIINEEAERQIELDRLDVELAVEGELDLNRDDIKKLIKTGDRMVMFFEGSDGKKKRLTLEWTVDVKDHEGWVYVDCNDDLYRKNGESTSGYATDKFIYIGSEQKDLKLGAPVRLTNVLKIGDPIALSRQIDGRAKPVDPYIKDEDNSTYYDTRIKPVILIGTDFQTKALNFA